MLQPCPGLTVVCGRNGSGKSSFAEAVELALTGDNQRWAEGRAKEWREGWRNLHQPEGARIDVELLVEGLGAAKTCVSRRWSDDAGLDDATCTVNGSGRGAQPLASLGWDEALSTFRPFLPYNELGRILGGRPSDLHDALWNILGLEQLTATQQRLADVAKALKTRADAARAGAKDLVAKAASLDDDRGARVAGMLAARTWDLPALTAAALGPSDGHGSPIGVLSVLVAVQPPSMDDLQASIVGLRAAADQAAALQGTDADRAARLADLLERALTHHGTDGDAPCPVCAGRLLDGQWHDEVTHRVGELREQARSVRAAGRAVNEAVQAARAILPPMPPALDGSAELGLPLPVDVRSVWLDFLDAPAGPAPLADHLEGKGPVFVDAVQQLAEAADAERRAREDLWQPFAEQLAAWLAIARTVQAESVTARHVKQALDWVKTTTSTLANARLEPLATQAASIWEQLRQESNVSLGPVRLEGSATRRRVNLDVTVDGSEASALGVMSQGELHALALSLFLPRATVPASPFRFLVIDDPVQAMDPTKVDGLAQVLSQVAKHRQVVVFTHDDRLPAAIRRLRLPATLLEVTRREGSVVDVVTVEDPAQRHLRDAEALTRDRHVDPVIGAKVVPGLCRLAIEATCVDRIRVQRLSAGERHTDVEALLETHPTLYHRMALALFNDPGRAGDVLTRLRAFGPWAPTVFTTCNKGAHPGTDTADLAALVHDTRRLLTKLQA